MFWIRRAVALALLVLFIVAIARACSGPEPAPAPEPATTTTQAAPTHIDQSRPVEMRIPAVGLTARFETKDCRVVDGAIDPGGLSKACIYTAADKPYELPGSDARDVVVIAGHAAAGVPAVFDKLYNPADEAHTLSPGDTLYLRTEASGDAWLTYEVTDLHDPHKTDLARDNAIWGSEPTPGRLLTISCVQPANPFEDSVRNAVIGWQFTGISLDDAP